jgi:beta-glucosidase
MTVTDPGASQTSLAAEPDVEALASRFPPDFAWGAATASYQIEGAVTADGRGPSIWDTFSHTPGKVDNGDTGDEACGHYHRWAEDLDLMQRLGLRAYRFSVAWPRVQPTGSGPVNPAGLDFYDRLVDGLLERGIEPWLTIYHWDLPQPLEDSGGWPDRQIVERFGEYAGILAGRFGDRVRHWITLNEPEIIATHGYAFGEHAPGRRDWNAALRTAHHIHLAHRAAVEAVRAAAPSAKVGITLNVAPVEPTSDDPADVAAAERRDAALNRWYLGPTFGHGYPAELVERYGALLDGVDASEVAGAAPPIDFLGVNYYARELSRDAPDRGPIGVTWGETSLPKTTMGWEVYPPGLTKILTRVARDYAPKAIAVTENGAAYDDRIGPDGSVDDPERRAYLASHIGAAADALEAGVPLTGYFAWSLLDNFEWARGYSKRFGIVHVDYATKRRKIKSSGHWYRALLAAARQSS